MMEIVWVWVVTKGVFEFEKCFYFFYFFFFKDTATTEIYTLSLHDALPIFLILPLQYPLGVHYVRPVLYGNQNR